jgi:response regulator of citrate/malate metabolism
MSAGTNAQNKLNGLLTQFPMTDKNVWLTNMQNLKQEKVDYYRQNNNNKKWHSELDANIRQITNYINTSNENNTGEEIGLNDLAKNPIPNDVTLRPYLSALRGVMNTVDKPTGGRRKSRRHRKNRVSRKSKKASRSRKSRSRK